MFAVRLANPRSITIQGKLRAGPGLLDDDSAAKSYDNLILDAHSNNEWHYLGTFAGVMQRQRPTGCIRDQLVSDLMLAAGIQAPRGRMVLLYLNGLLWGLYDLHERPDAHFCASYFGGKDEEYDVVKHRPSTVVSGSAESWREATAMLRQPWQSPANLQDFRRLVNITDLAVYLLRAIFM